MKTHTRSVAMVAIAFGILSGLFASRFFAASAAPQPALPQKTLALSKATTLGFGEWQAVEANVAYKAEEDGFVAAYTGGNNSADGAHLFTGNRPEMGAMVQRTRINPGYGGAMMPVAKGDYWLVKTEGGRIVIHWMPVRLAPSAPASNPTKP